MDLPQDSAPGVEGSPPRYKRGRGHSFFKYLPKDNTCCQVPECGKSLVDLKRYYKRYKICPEHMEMSHMVVEGHKIRFCQQCGRFQLLSDFDGNKKSCRSRLAKHNGRRRRQPKSSHESNQTVQNGAWDCHHKGTDGDKILEDVSIGNLWSAEKQRQGQNTRLPYLEVTQEYYRAKQLAEAVSTLTAALQPFPLIQHAPVPRFNTTSPTNFNGANQLSESGMDMSRMMAQTSLTHVLEKLCANTTPGMLSSPGYQQYPASQQTSMAHPRLLQSLVHENVGEGSFSSTMTGRPFSLQDQDQKNLQTLARYLGQFAQSRSIP